MDVGSGTHAEETGKMLMGIEKVLKEEKPAKARENLLREAIEEDKIFVTGNTIVPISKSVTLQSG